MARILASEADVAEGVDALLALDRRLVPVLEIAGKVRLRRSQPGFAGLAAIVVAQQLSVASADAIHGRLVALVDPMTAAGLAAAEEAALRACGLSRPKIRTLRALAEAELSGALDFAGLGADDPEAARAALTKVSGIGPWTADIFLLFGLGHADIFPAGDLALKNAVAEALALAGQPSTAELEGLAACWSPWRGVAACLFWAYYRARRGGREAAPV
ncbi:MAG TPA: DNA-3-methyladenine glycosylase 2 family protein [Hyphomicrobiales bacterium]|nr:DNA-3-methyladenine glycosylase 2 family protein [Kaistiaceae bacterium]HQF30194.1 DNA-3-methyladenine glycosylase 2 family protein [Hyphomicrobiales bacterium]